MRTALLIARCGRPAMLHETVASLQHQTCPPASILICVASEDDIAPETRLLPRVQVVFSPHKSSSIQRNIALDAAPPDTELVIFIDDDVELAPGYLQQARDYFLARPEVAAMCGDSLDGALFPSREAARAALAAPLLAPPREIPSRGLYGCNMNVRAQVARGVRFDERLMFYAFMEDHDFGARCEAHGKVMQFFGGCLVHFRESSGRNSKTMLGYAQMMNPYYLWRKGSIHRAEFVARGPRFLLANLRGLVLGMGSRKHRWQALRRNLLALRDIALHGPAPERIAHLQP